MEISRARMAQARVRLSANVVEQVTQGAADAGARRRGAAVLGVCKPGQPQRQTSAELARRIRRVGNFTKLQRARQQSFYADSAAQLASASMFTSTAARGKLIRQLGLTDAQAAQLKLPERLPGF